MYYNKQGKQIELMEFAKLSQDRSYKNIKQTTLKDGKWISTVWLGINHSFDKNLLIFETMVFPNKGNWGEIDMDRYPTLKEAKAGHEKMVKKYKR